MTTNKASGGDGIPVELFQILKDDAVESAALNMQYEILKSQMYCFPNGNWWPLSDTSTGYDKALGERGGGAEVWRVHPEKLY